jgi:hypothetical protein
LQHIRDIRGKRPKGTAPQVGNVYCDPATWLEDALAFVEDIAQKRQIFEVCRWNAIPPESFLVLFPREVGRRGDDQGDRVGSNPCHLTSIGLLDVIDAIGTDDVVVLGYLGRSEALVEERGIMTLTLRGSEA